MKSEGPERLAKIAERLKADIEKRVAPSPYTTTIRQLLGWFGYERRGIHIVSRIRRALAKHELRTTPDFASGWIDETISIQTRQQASQDLEDPTVRVGALEAAHLEPLTVTPDQPLETATTLMALHDFSQLPVTQNLHDIRGVVSWSSIGSRLSLGQTCPDVKDCMEPAIETSIDDPLLSAIERISKHGYTLVRGKARKITGIVTVSDVGSQFTQLAGPFLIIGEIEGYLRTLAHNRFKSKDLKDVVDPDDQRDVDGIADLTFGELCRLLGARERWNRLQLKLCRKSFVARLEEIRKIRNDVVHFNPDGLNPKERRMLNDTVGFFRDLRRKGAI